MRRGFSMVVTACVAVLGSCNSESEAPSEQKITIIEEESILGNLTFRPGFQEIKVEAGTETIETKIVATNTGSKAVTVTQLESGCSCLSVEMDTKIVEPGTTAVISGVFSTEKLSGKTEKMITVQTDESSIRKAFLKVRLDIDPLYEISESMTNWKVGEEASTKTVVFEVKRDQPIHVLKAKSMRDEVTCELVTVEKGRRYELKLTPASTANTLLGIVKIETDCEIPAHANALAYFSIQ